MVFGPESERSLHSTLLVCRILHSTCCACSIMPLACEFLLLVEVFCMCWIAQIAQQSAFWIHYILMMTSCDHGLLLKQYFWINWEILAEHLSNTTLLTLSVSETISGKGMCFILNQLVAWSIIVTHTKTMLLPSMSLTNTIDI